MVHLITGNTGAGKTTYAYQLKKSTNGVVFSIDQWNSTLFLMDKKPEDGLEWFLERIERAEKMIMNLVKQLEKTSTDSILDLGFSKLAHRDKFRNFAQSNGFEITIHFLDIPRDIRLKRVLERNEEQGDTFEFEVKKEDFDFMEDWFEKPTVEELAGGITIQE
ncbi:ATP-binding protein [Membranicola marinus]|uniref:ATP-binding protein n=1 Tax=Membranihabitans marinus TaxID=1227546 RepID=A0A953HN01_9BACT|nr:ATP-binding protein [Membranihabitans marinus]MBY5958612.1 ATP-binding protein [Membranihabitans marinus]